MKHNPCVAHSDGAIVSLKYAEYDTGLADDF